MWEEIMKKVLITGINGFLGNHLFQHFKQKGFSVRGWSRNINEENGSSISFVDMRDPVAVEEALITFIPDIIIHCAGSANVNLSVSNPEQDFTGNVVLTHNLLFGLKKAGLKKTRVVFLSSAAVYGNPVSLPINENAQLNPLSPYALHKIMCEEICEFMAINFDFDIKIARIFSAYGIGLKKQIFWDMFNKAEKTGKLDMFGTGYESRDYIHFKDVVNAIFLVANNARREDLIFNIGNGNEITIREATETFAEIYGITAENICFKGDVREGEPKYWKADITKLKALGYNPQIPFNKGIKEYVDWAASLTNKD
jgi:UDP-glucose 4-epimerase